MSITRVLSAKVLGAGTVAALLAIAAGGAVFAHDEEGVYDGDRTHNRNLLHDTDIGDGHVPPNVNYGFEVIGQDTLGGIADGKYTDVWAHEGYAYVGTFQEPTCDRAGVYISDIRDPSNPTTINMIASPPGTRINDVKVHEIDSKDVLAVTLEPCGPLVGQGRVADQGQGAGGSQQGQGGVALWDVSDPLKPHALKQNFLDFATHNTFSWTTDAGTYMMVVDDTAIQDTHIVDVSKPQSPKLISTTGILDWIAPAMPTGGADEDGQLFTGAFATPLLHDIWVEQTAGGEWHAVLSYWDAGFIVLDVTDPYNPVFLGDSTYPATDPVHGTTPAEGNAHAAVFGGDNMEFIFGGDEDFDASQVGIFADGAFYTASQGTDVPQVLPGDSVAGPTTYVGLACVGPVPAPTSADDIAIIQRGDCSFTTKAATVEAAGYQAGIVFNHATGCAASVSMLVEAGIPMLFVPRPSGFAILNIAGYDPATCTGSGSDNGDALLSEGSAGHDVDISAQFDGWGYFHVLNNTMADVTVPHGADPAVTAGYLGEIGYYAPAEARDPDLATGSGDLTMHNLEADPDERNRSYISWYSAGMRAVEWRPGHLHNDLLGEGVVSWNVHEVGRFIAEDGSNFWGVHVTEIAGEKYILGSDRNTGLWIFQFECEEKEDDDDIFYCSVP